MDTDDRDYQTWTPEQLIAQIEVLEREKLRLQQIEKISEAQRDLSRSVSTMEYAASGRLRLKSMLLEILRVSNQLLESEESSIFLLDESGVVVESILARGAMIKEHKQSLIGKVLDKGLAGWVMRIKKPGKVEDTKTWPPYCHRGSLTILRHS